MDKSLIMESRFVVKVPTMATYSDFDLDHLGVFINEESGNSKEKYFGEDLTAVGWTIYEMAKAHSNGYPVKLVSGGDITFIYNTLQNFLEEVHMKKRYSPNDPKVFMSEEDVELLDAFAEEVFNINTEALKIKHKEETNTTFGFNNSKHKILERGQFLDNTRNNDNYEYTRKSYRPRKSMNLSDILKK